MTQRKSNNYSVACYLKKLQPDSRLLADIKTFISFYSTTKILCALMVSITANDTVHFPELFKTKSRDAFAELYDKYSAAIYSIIYKMAANTNTAEELLQDVFVKVWRNANKYDASKGSLFAWMLQITRNTYIDYLRTSQHKMQLNTNGGLKKHETIFASNEMYYNTENTELRGLAFKLEHKYRQIIDLVYFWGYSQEEVAQMLKSPLGTVKTRSPTGLQRLRELYQQINL